MSKETNDPKRSHKIRVLIMLLLSTVFLVASINSIITLFTDIEMKDMYTIKGVILSKPEISTGAKGTKSIKFKLKGITEFEFMTEFPAYNTTKRKQLFSEVNQKDTIEVDIKKSDYEIKIAKMKEKTIFDFLNYRFISIYGLRKNNSIYLKLDDYNKEADNDAKYGWWAYLLMSMGGIVYLYYEHKIHKTEYL